MSAEIAVQGSTVQIRVLMYDGSAAQTGLSINVSIERLSDGKYWDGAAWQVAYQALSMTELAGDVHLAGVYQYNFVTPSTAGVFDWRVTHNGASFDRAFAGRISTVALQDVLDFFENGMPELTGDPGVTPTLWQALMLAYMPKRNVLTSGGVSPNQKLEIRNSAGTIILEADEDFGSGTKVFTKSKLVEP